jgi:hypothetical protein
MNKDEIIVKIITKGSHLISDSPSSVLNPSFPEKKPKWGSCRFVFGNEQAYDWLVVYDDFVGKIHLNCPPQNTLLVTSEPSSIKTYESAYIQQFGYVLTGQEDWALKHPGKIHSQPALFWFYGVNNSQNLSYDQTQKISTVTSAKRQKHTLHNKRYQFIEALHRRIPELDRFGKGIREINDKADALDPYKYHIAIENHRCDHWWTEKLSDAFLGLTLPFYYGAPNADEYFPPESFIEIDINDFEGSYQKICEAIKNKEYERRLPYIKEARRRVLEEYNFYATIAKIIQDKQLPGNPPSTSQNLWMKSRKELRKNPILASYTYLQKLRNKLLKYVRCQQP